MLPTMDSTLTNNAALRWRRVREVLMEDDNKHGIKRTKALNGKSYRNNMVPGRRYGG